MQTKPKTDDGGCKWREIVEQGNGRGGGIAFVETATVGCPNRYGYNFNDTHFAKLKHDTGSRENRRLKGRVVVEQGMSLSQGFDGTICRR